MLSDIKLQANKATKEILEAAKLERGDVFVVGCSSSEVAGEKIGSHSSVEVAQAVFEGIYPVLKENGIYIAAQCCEHLNRAIIIEREAAREYGLERVNAIPQPKAGGSFATVTYNSLLEPCTVETVKAGAGIDIGGVLIGMHLRATAVPVRISIDKIGKANIICARTRPKFVGGERAVYNKELL